MYDVPIKTMKGCGSSLGAPIVSSYGWEEQFCVLYIVCYIGNKREKKNTAIQTFPNCGAKINLFYERIVFIF